MREGNRRKGDVTKEEGNGGKQARERERERESERVSERERARERRKGETRKPPGLPATTAYQTDRQDRTRLACNGKSTGRTKIA